MSGAGGRDSAQDEGASTPEPADTVVATARALAAEVIGGDTRAAARACRWVDEGWPGHAELLAALQPVAPSAEAPARSWSIGVTGSPGVGKSTLTSRLVQHFRAQGARVGVVAVDPTSPFSGGAVLGDRIRMQAHWADRDVFVRSVATRGAHGGLSRTTADISRVLAAWGAGIVLIETVGVGQDELDVMGVADTTLVIVAPGAGDDIQASKAGLLECADVFAVNKAELPGADAVADTLRAMLLLGHVTGSASPGFAGHSAALAQAPSEPREQTEHAESWDVPVVSCVATRDEGVDTLVEQLIRHRSWLTTSPRGRAHRRRRSKVALTQRVREAVSQALLERHRDELEEIAERVANGELDPYAAKLAFVQRWV